ncbi:MAG TPA: RNB domain-containing ribonuclease [Ilumatobacteraceae bacterium]|nr:RNB domain-containing ribonuclease [Ilumatobacteraceae bacterium]
MKIRADLTDELVEGLAVIRDQFKVPAAFPAPVVAAAAEAARRQPTAHVDRTDWPFATLDPASATDLDQAFHIEIADDDVLLHYAIADVAWFVVEGDPIDAEAWDRGTTQYLPDGRAGLYPADLSEGAASLLPDGPRPAVVFHVRVDGGGEAKLDGAERSIVHSRAKLGYENVSEAQLPDALPELARRIAAAEERRGASRVEPPEQEVRVNQRGAYDIIFRPRTAAQDHNAAMSLATNLAIADALFAAGTGLFRVMPDPDGRAEQRLRHTARALGLDWPASMPLRDFERSLHNGSPKPAAMAMAIRRAGGGASYVPFAAGERPWHSAMAATYVHATAPLRRLADRYVVMAALAVANGQPVADDVRGAFPKLPPVMDRADHTAAQIEHAVIELAESVLLSGQVQRTFPAVVTDVDQRGARIQLCDLPVVSRITAQGLEPGDDVRVRIASVDVPARTATLERVA